MSVKCAMRFLRVLLIWPGRNLDARGHREAVDLSYVTTLSQPELAASLGAFSAISSRVGRSGRLEAGGEEVRTAGVRSYQDERSASSCHKLGYLWERRDAVSWLDGKMRPNAAVQGIRVS